MSDRGTSFEDLLAAAFEQAAFGISVVDPTGRQLGGNAAYARLIGREVTEIRRLDLSDLTKPGELEWNRRWLRELADGDRSLFTTDRVFLLPGGEERTLRVTAWPVRREGVAVAIVQTVTVVPPPAGLADGRVRKLIENIDNTISLMDADGNLLETSGRYRPVLGYPREFWETRTIFDLLHPDDALRLLDLRAKVLSEPGHLLEDEVRVRSIEGSYEPLHVAAVNLLDDPDVAGIVVTSRNIAKEKALLSELAARTERAENESRLRNELVATVSHELRNPLHAISGLAELLAVSELPDDALALANTLHRQTVALAGVLDDLLDASRFAASGMPLRSASVRLRVLVADVVSLAASRVMGRHVTVTGTVDPSLPESIHADETRLRQVLSNLLGNAVKFTEHGEVTLTVTGVGDDELLFEVADSGRGIPADEVDKVFEPFTSARNGGDVVGAGLGLSIVRQLVTSMRGTVDVASTLGAGSVFSVRLPLSTAEEVGPVQPTGVSPVDHVVLIVEDNEVNQTLARNQLMRLGYRSIVVGSGEEALRVLAQPNSPRLVLMDFQLPGIDGLETTRRLRAAERDGDRRVVIGVTASAMAADRAACVAAGMDDFVAKPVGLVALSAILAKWTDGDTVAPALASSSAADAAAALDELARELGDTMIVHQLIDTYLRELDDRSNGVQAAVAGERAELVRRSAHALKSSSSLLGLTELAAACQELEHRGAAGEVAIDGAAHIPGLVEAARRVLTAWKSEHPLVGS